MKTPPYLKKGDTVAIVCTASAVKGGIADGIRILKSWGLQVLVSPSVSATWHTFAGSDALRQEDLQQALDDGAVKAVFAARGGYGTVRIIDAIDFTSFAQNPKWLIGFSDITVLHSHIQRQTSVKSIHGQMPKSFEKGTAPSLESLRQALFGEDPAIQYTTANAAHRDGEAEGELIGGNLAILQSILGSDSDPEYDDKILFIEDVGEALYNTDRMLRTLKRAGKLAKLRGLIVGGFTAIRESDPPFGQDVPQIVREIVAEYTYPVAFDFPAGHIEDNHALVFGATAQLSVAHNRIKLTYIS
ncbi:S66 peptidase family protein [Sphingobacterium chungjuense]|uniref:S66 peptidase family protein n=1 Tax=Sphingobacterium chungjuense TaxID=2675553 RepID=UPI00140BC4E1|nr:LD-carboxypeptidase [Sphingobacterium chungjuense]